MTAACPLPEFLFQGEAFSADFRIACRIADGASGPHVIEFGNQAIGHLPVDRQKDDIGRRIEFVDGSQATFAGDLVSSRIDDVDISGKPQVPGRGNGRFEEGAADIADAVRVKGASKVCVTGRAGHVRRTPWITIRMASGTNDPSRAGAGQG